jgi:hypothetical protein
MIERMSAFLGSPSLRSYRILAGKLWFVGQQHSLPFRSARGRPNSAEQKHFDSRKEKWELELNKQQHSITF